MNVNNENLNDNIKLLELQDRFLNGDSSAWSELWVLSLEVCKRIIKSEQKQKGFFLNEDDFEDKASCAVEYVLRRYRKKYKSGKSYRIEKNFVSALYFGVIHALYYRSEKDRAFEDVYLIDDVMMKKLKNIAVYDKRVVKVKI